MKSLTMFDQSEQGCVRELHRTRHGLPVQVENGKLVLRIGPEVGAVLMPTALGKLVRAELSAGALWPPIIAHRGTTWFVLTSRCDPGLDYCTPNPERFSAQVTVMHPGSLIILPDGVTCDGKPLRTWIDRPSGVGLPTVAEVLASVAKAIQMQRRQSGHRP